MYQLSVPRCEFVILLDRVYTNIWQLATSKNNIHASTSLQELGKCMYVSYNFTYWREVFAARTRMYDNWKHAFTTWKTCTELHQNVQEQTAISQIWEPLHWTYRHLTIWNNLSKASGTFAELFQRNVQEHVTTRLIYVRVVWNIQECMCREVCIELQPERVGAYNYASSLREGCTHHIGTQPERVGT